ncbi:MAG: hypothetical protein EWV55_11805 [Microcystis viridis Mv_BB_P_19951000_S69]|nr:MAG: hypothetical protein EWV55_11805 [Microcystis viridis Mv_BB_P_19951000_S69]
MLVSIHEVRDLRFDNVPFGRTQLGRAFEMLGTCALIICHLAGLVLLQSDFQSWDIIPTQVPKRFGTNADTKLKTLYCS